MDAEIDFRFVITILIIAIVCACTRTRNKDEIKMVEKFHFKSILIYMNIVNSEHV